MEQQLTFFFLEMGNKCSQKKIGWLGSSYSSFARNYYCT
jgi:uncharacterized protein YneF (UPF0154 family)